MTEFAKEAKILVMTRVGAQKSTGRIVLPQRLAPTSKSIWARQLCRSLRGPGECRDARRCARLSVEWSLILGIGVSGPQVVEVVRTALSKALARTREWMQIFRKIADRKEPVAHEGKQYQLPLKGGTGLASH